ncbi:RnfH family protein [uncultured Kushneria sp.]|uniref:RnfH family protein n=1 Tax=uncultured Kushneria sp. TaxID=905033 RepID=UPI002630EE34|nr:RnfH family protein [uncultured Kushneria sp.]
MHDEEKYITCEVVWATPESQYLEIITVPLGTTVLGALETSGFCNRVSELRNVPLNTLKLGIFGEHVKSPADQPVHQGDRIEIYRPLQVDPKQARRARARRKV